MIAEQRARYTYEPGDRPDWPDGEELTGEDVLRLGLLLCAPLALLWLVGLVCVMLGVG